MQASVTEKFTRGENFASMGLAPRKEQVEAGNARFQYLLQELSQAHQENLAQLNLLYEENTRLKALLELHEEDSKLKHRTQDSNSVQTLTDDKGELASGRTPHPIVSTDDVDGRRNAETPAIIPASIQSPAGQRSRRFSDKEEVAAAPACEIVAYVSSMTEQSWNVNLKGFWTNVPETFSSNYALKGVLTSSGPPDMTGKLTFTEKQELDGSVFGHNGGTDHNDGSACSRILIDPGSTKRMVWDVSGMVLIGWDLLTIPLMAFDEPEDPVSEVMGWVTLLFWTSDMVWAILTGYLKDGKIIMDFKKIVINYLKTWFLVDCIVVVPDWAMKIMGGDGKAARAGRVLRAFRAIRVLRLLRLLKLKKLIVMIYDYIDSEYMFILVSLAKLILILLVLNHLVACAWYAIGKYTKDNGSEKNWLQDVGKTPVWGETLAWKYFTSLHWSITQFTPASMDIYATNLLERVFSVLILFWALLCLSSFIGSVSASVTQLRSLGADESKQFWLLRRYLKQQKVPKSTKDRIMNFLEYKAEASRDLVKREKIGMLNQLSDGLKFELASALNAPTLMGHPLFEYLARKMKPMLVRTCHTAVQIQSFAALDIVFYPEHEAFKMFLVKSGIFSYIRRGAETDTPVLRKTWICEAALWMKWVHCGHLSSSASGDLAGIDPEAFAKIMRMHPRPFYFAMQYAEAFAASIANWTERDLSDYVELDLVPDLQEAEQRGRLSCQEALGEIGENDTPHALRANSIDLTV